MANNYEQYSEVIACDNKEQQTWLMDELRRASNTILPEGIGDFEEWPHTNDVWIYAEEFTSNLDDLCAILQKFLKHFELDRYIVISTAYTCSKMRIAEFGGGAVGITRDTIVGIDAREYITSLLKG